MKKLYDITPIERKQHNSSQLRVTKKELVLFKHKIGLPIGKKDNIKIPDWIMNNNDYKIACPRGIFDTDASINFRRTKSNCKAYPRIKVSSKS